MNVLGVPEVTVIGASDIHKMAAFLNVLGAEAQPAPTLDDAAAQALYGLAGPLRQIVLRTPGGGGSIRVVETPNAAAPFEPLVVGPYGVDYYATDVTLSMGLARATGAYVTDLVEYDVRGEVMLSEEPQYETRYVGPEALSVFVSDIHNCGHRFPTLLDTDPGRLHSELNMLCWVVGDLESTARFWTEEAGLQVVVDRFEGEEGMIDLMAHPGPTPLRTINVADSGRERRMEFMHYTDAETGSRPDWPLHGGLHAAGFYVDDVERTMAALPSATFEPVTQADEGHGPKRAVAGQAPGGVRFELWER